MMSINHRRSAQPNRKTVRIVEKQDILRKYVLQVKKIHTVEEDQFNEDCDMNLLHIDSLEIGSVEASPKPDEWWEHVTVGKGTLMCQLDTGAQASVMGTHHLQKVAPGSKLEKTKQRLVSYSKHLIIPNGYAMLPVTYKNITSEVKFYIVEHSQKPVLSGEACKDLKLVQRIYGIDPSTEELLSKHPELDKATGDLPGTHSIKIDPTVTPVIHGPRRQPAALLPRIIEKLKEMESEGHIAKVTQPTDWVNSMVVATRKEKIRICLDPSDLNEAVERQHYPIPTVEEIIAKMPDCKVFTVLDAKNGYLQLRLDYESSLLTTMNTPIGRYRWLKLPFGIKSAPELYQRKMDEMLEGILFANAVMDDILVAGRDEAHHNKVLKEVLQRATNYNLKLNFEKVKVRKNEVPYVGHIISAEGLKPDPEKIKAVRDMPAPESKESVRRFLGFVQYLAKFLPMLAEVEVPLRELTKDKAIFHWDAPQREAFSQLKKLCCEAPVLKYYNVREEVTIQCDASNHAVGAVLLQKGRPVAYASRKLRDSENNWAPIEKEMLAIVFSTQKFREYIVGKQTTVQTDHKPLETILRKPLISAPLRLQTMILKIKGYDLKVEYLPGKKQWIADTLSRASPTDAPPEDEEFTVNMIDKMSVSDQKYAEFQQKTADELHELYKMILAGWPETKEQVPHSIREYWLVRDELAVLDGIAYRGQRIVVPPTMRSRMLDLIHETHLGTVKSKQRARETLYWPGMSSEIEEKVQDCPVCHDYQAAQQKEPLIPSQTPDLPWSEAASDLFTYESDHYVLSVDYYSRYIEVSKLKDLSSYQTIEALKEHFGRHGVPKKLTTDCGSQYTSAEFADFANGYKFEHVLISPKHPQANGEAEAAVKTVKSLWRKNKDKQKALLMHRATPLPGINLSPSQLCMGRRLRSNLPMAQSLLEPEAHNLSEVKRRMTVMKDKQKVNYDRGTKELPPLKPGDTVRIRPEPGSKVWKPATVVEKHNTPRSYIVDTGERKLRRNRVALRSDSKLSNAAKPSFQSLPPDDNLPVPTVNPDMQTPPQQEVQSTPPTPSPTKRGNNIAFTTRSGRSVRPPNKLNLLMCLKLC